MGKLYKNKEWLYQKYWDEGLSTCRIASKYNFTPSQICKYLKILGIPVRTRSEARSGERHPNWRGGRNMETRGYIRIYCPEHPYATKRKCVYEHRLVMEKHLGRYLQPNEIVHHIDGNKQNNKIENLLLTKNEKHKIHYVDGYREGYKKGFAKGFIISYLASRYKDFPK